RYARSEIEYLAAWAGDAAVCLAFDGPVRVQPAGDSVGPAHAIAAQDCGGQHQRSPAALLPCRRAARERRTFGPPCARPGRGTPGRGGVTKSASWIRRLLAYRLYRGKDAA